MLDVNKEGVLGKKQSRDFLRCAGWCLPDDELDSMLSAPGSKNERHSTSKGLTYLIKDLRHIVLLLL